MRLLNYQDSLVNDQDSLVLETLVAAVARSPIVVARPAVLLPAGFDEVDLAILSWIAAEAPQRRNFTLM
jgi:hypothetical protein